MKIAAKEKVDRGVLYVRGMTLKDIAFVRKYAMDRNMSVGECLEKVVAELRKGDSAPRGVKAARKKVTSKR